MSRKCEQLLASVRVLICSIGKALVVCPVSLVNNWAQEFKKWCASKSTNTVLTIRARGDITIVPVGDKEDSRTAAFVSCQDGIADQQPNNPGLHVMIIGYEKVSHRPMC